MRTTSIDTTVLNGLPVTIEAEIANPEPDVGFDGYYVSDWKIVAVAGKRKNCWWIEKRLTDDDIQDFVDEILENYK